VTLYRQSPFPRHSDILVVFRRLIAHATRLNLFFSAKALASWTELKLNESVSAGTAITWGTLED
jgi:hypothetical protein